MSFLLDTNILSETTRAQPHPGVLGWIAAQSTDSLFLSAITIGELQRGALLLADGKRRKALQHWIEAEVKAAFARRILALDTEVLEQWARLTVAAERAGRRLPLMDSLLAATAQTHRLTLVTRNIADFEATGVPLLNLWQE